jgi:ABC-2 type transport system permease protein
MTSITVILKEETIMNSNEVTLSGYSDRRKERSRHPFRVIMEKEMADHLTGWRFIILTAIIALTCLGSLYTALSNMPQAVKPNDPEGTFFFLKLFTISDGTMPSFMVFIGFLGPLLGIGLGFDAINSEHNRGTLSRILSQPIHRDYIINAKFAAALAVISGMLIALGMLVMGAGLVTLGIPPTAEEFVRMLLFIFLSILYVAFWLNLSILFSVLFRQPATAALSAIAVWLFFTVFYPLIVNLVTKSMEPSATASPYHLVAFEQFRLALLRVMPNQLFSEATTTLLMPSVRSLGPLTMEQMIGAVPGPLPLGQSILLVWPQITGLTAGTIVSFVISYILFMRREIRPR